MFYSERAPPVLTALPEHRILSDGEPFISQNLYTDTIPFSVKDKIVSGNQWFSTGNYFVAPSGYYPACMYYYDVKIRNKLVSTKEEHTKIIASDPVKTKTGKYFLVSNVKEGKFQICYLKN